MWRQIQSFVKGYAFILLMTVMFFAAMVLLFDKQLSIIKYREHSHEHTFTVDLQDNLGWSEFIAIQKNLEATTHQPVYAELVDQQRKIYRLRIKCPPDQVSHIWGWLTDRQWVEDAQIERAFLERR